MSGKSRKIMHSNRYLKKRKKTIIKSWKKNYVKNNDKKYIYTHLNIEIRIKSE